jgi:hypothetical protein
MGTLYNFIIRSMREDDEEELAPATPETEDIKSLINYLTELKRKELERQDKHGDRPDSE